MAAKLQAQGITCFVDKAGRKWGLTQYCSMATRTTQRQAQVSAALTADDWDLWQIAKIGSTCPLCSVYEGRVYSKSGTDPDYPPLTMAFGKIDPKGINDLTNSYLNIHPNCLHSLVRYTTMGKTDEQIQRDKDFSSFEKRPANVDYRTKKQQEAYRQKEAERAAFRRDMKQFNKYKAALGKDFPKTFETFEKHKKLNDDVYKEWERKFREQRMDVRNIYRGLNKRNDPLVDVLGSAQKSHPEEVKRIKAFAETHGVTIKSGRNSMAYAPGLKKGLPGQLLIDESDSIGAWLHEEQHMIDDFKNGWQGFEGLFDVEKRARMEYNAYRREIDFANKIGRPDIADKLRDICRDEIVSFGGKWDESLLR